MTTPDTKDLIARLRAAQNASWGLHPSAAADAADALESQSAELETLRASAASVQADQRAELARLAAELARVRDVELERCARAAKEALLALSPGERASGDIAVHAAQSAMGWPAAPTEQPAPPSAAAAQPAAGGACRSLTPKPYALTHPEASRILTVCRVGMGHLEGTPAGEVFDHQVRRLADWYGDADPGPQLRYLFILRERAKGKTPSRLVPSAATPPAAPERAVVCDIDELEKLDAAMAARVAQLEAALQETRACLLWHYEQGHSHASLGGFRLKLDEAALRRSSAALAGAQEKKEPQP